MFFTSTAKHLGSKPSSGFKCMLYYKSINQQSNTQKCASKLKLPKIDFWIYYRQLIKYCMIIHNNENK